MAPPYFGNNGHASAFGPPPSGQMAPGLAAHYAQQAFQHAQRDPQNQTAQINAAAWAQAAAAAASPQGASGATGPAPQIPPAGASPFSMPPLGQNFQAPATPIPSMQPQTFGPQTMGQNNHGSLERGPSSMPASAFTTPIHTRPSTPTRIKKEVMNDLASRRHRRRPRSQDAHASAHLDTEEQVPRELGTRLLSTETP